MKIVPETIARIRQALEDPDLGQLIGLKEDLWFEGKVAGAYNLETPAGRFELAKDVSALANSEGGYLILGLRLEALILEKTEKVVALDLGQAGSFNESQFAGVIKEYVYPEIEALEIQWVTNPTDESEGLGIIFVPRQNEGRKYFLVSKIVEEGVQLRQIVFGLCRRDKNSNVPFNVSDLYQAMQRGKNPISQRLTIIEDKVDYLIHALLAQTDLRESPWSRLDKRLKDLSTKT